MKSECVGVGGGGWVTLAPAPPQGSALGWLLLGAVKGRVLRRGRGGWAPSRGPGAVLGVAGV